MSETTTAPTVALSNLPAVGQPLEGGLFAGLTTRRDGVHCAVVLLSAAPSKRLDWDAATAWAAEQGGELPTRPVSALLFANLRGEFDAAWHWTAEKHEDDGAFAWSQHFNDGFQDINHTSFEARVRAVRLIPLSA